MDQLQIHGRRVMTASVDEMNDFIEKYKEYFVIPKDKNKVSDYDHVETGHPYKILPYEYKNDGVNYIPIKFYMSSKDFSNRVYPKCDYKRSNGSYTYFYNPTGTVKKACQKTDCIHITEDGKCALSYYDYITCTKANYVCFVKQYKAKSGFGIHEKAVHTSSGVRFGW